MDYEHQNFSISQRASRESSTPTFVPILSTSHYSAPAGLDQGSKIGIAVGVVVGCILVASGLVIWYWKRRKRSGEKDVAPVQETQTLDDPKYGDNMTELSSPGAPVWEAPGTTSIRPHELDSEPVLEMGDREMHQHRAELPGA